MGSWTAEDLETFGHPDEVTIATMRKDGTLRKYVIVWIVVPKGLEPALQPSPSTP